MNTEVVNTDQPAEFAITEILPDAPAKAADDQKADPASGAEEQKPEGEVSEVETEAQKEERRQSRRQRARERDAARLASAETETRLLREQLERQQAKQTPETSEKPQRDKFDSLEDYHEALAEWKAELTTRQTLETDRKARQEQETQARTVESERKLGDEWKKAEESFRREAKDYDEVVAEFIESELADLDPTTRRAILRKGPAVLYHLAKNDAIQEQLAKLSAEDQVMEIGVISKELQSRQKKQSSAPAPVSGVKGSSASHNITGNETQAEYEAKRKAQGNARWAR